ncbi:excinuclease ABC subunit UvrC [Devriesea agamarum]|uniref:excinuclease ABC subunit UvrC n=1 Tax=Devriesea agamarum TaxID=472569 RepID=UPI00071CBA15|nr:excinuclease ABC subunit UvrC [Devriesea agamarum]
MADPVTYRPSPGSIPTTPGVYRFRDQDGRVIYVGKAKNLRARLSNYFQDLASLHPRTRRMVTTACSVEWTVVGTEVEALTLEYSWIKEFDPRFNVKFRDDKSYPYLAVTMGDKIPRALVTRRAKKPGDRFFGPYTHVWAIRETLDLLLRVFPVRTCSPGVYRRAERSARPCLLGFIDKCSAPCVGRIDAQRHHELAEQLCDFMAGNTGKYVRKLEDDMRRAAEELDFETAARYRDDLQALTKVREKNTVVLSDATDADVIGIAMDELEASIQVFHVRGGRIRGQRGWTVELVDSSGLEDLVERTLTTLYEDSHAPKEVLVPHLPSSLDELRAHLGASVDIRVPQRGEKKDLHATVTANAADALRLHKLRRTGDLTARSKALEDLATALGLDTPPLRIECYDVSHSQGTNVVASMVVFEDGLPRKSEYRRFSIRGEAARDDTASLHDVISRRLARHLAERDRTCTSEATAPGHFTPEDPQIDSPEAANTLSTNMDRRFAYPPSLIVVDGGPAQVAAAQAAFDEHGITDIALVGLAKRLEEVWLPGDEFPVILPRTSDALFLLQRLRDEAHRFAIAFHRSKRGRAMQESILDQISGLGPKRRAALLAQFTTVKALRAADPQEIAKVPGFGPALAEQVWRALQSEKEEPAVNMTTGEILDPS